MAGPMPDPGQAQPEQQQAQPGGASQLVADTHSNLLKLQELVGAKFPEEGQALAQITQAFQAFVEGLGQAPGAEGPQGPASPGTTTPEAGAAKTQPVM